MEAPGLQSPPVMRRILTFSAIVEAGTGLALVAAPAFVLSSLIGGKVAEESRPLGRCFGIAILALVMACWPGREPSGGPTAFRGLLSYNALIALYLAVLGAAAQWTGLLLWPVVGLHALVALALILLWRRGQTRR